jgi:glyoxylate/hydroxypyruvate reductase A
VKILLQTPRDRSEQWQRALRAALPDAEIAVWPAAMEEPDYALVWKPPAEIFARTRPKRAIFNLGAGVEALLSVPGLPDDVPVIRLENAGMASQMAEYVTLAVLSAFREAREYAAQQRAGLWQPRPPLPKRDFGVGLLGFGVLGQAVARFLEIFEFPLSGWSATRKVFPGVTTFAGPRELAPFLASAHVLVCLLPSTPETRGLLDRTNLSRLPPGAHLVNVARGNIVVEPDLVALLDEGHLSGATLDVFHEEPLPAGHPFWHHPKVTLTPHTSAITVVDDSIAQIAAKIARLECGETVTGVVDRVRGY